MLLYSHQHKAFGYVDSFVWNTSFYKDRGILLNLRKYNYQPCFLLKSIYHPPKPSLTRATKSLKCIFSDLPAKAPILLLGGSFYYITFIDDFTCFAWIYFFKIILQAVATIKNFINMIENQTSFIISQFCLARGSKYANNQLTVHFL